MIANMDGGASPSLAESSADQLFNGRAVAGHEEALERGRDWLLAQQRDDGHWVGELEGDTILESEYVLLLAFLGREHEDVCRKCANYMLKRQLPEGGWSIYPGGPLEISASVKAYFVLKLLGYKADDPMMVKAREAILAHGGAANCNSFTRFYLALLGQISYDDCPTVPPELVLIPSWFPFTLSAMSAWTRPIIVPLMIVSHFKPVRKIEPSRGIEELFIDGSRRRPKSNEPLFSWARFFLAADRGMKWADRILPNFLRRRGVKAAHRWMLERFEDSDGLGAIFPPMIYTIVALKCLGYEDDSEVVQWAWRQLNDLIIREGDTVRLQPCVSPVWDTAISTIALSDALSGAEHPALEKAAEWLLDKELRRGGDWQVRRPKLEPSGWHFQYANGFYPDIDDSAMVMMAILRSPEAGGADRVAAALKRAENWILGMQSRDGGWAAFDVDIDNEVLTKVPFADHNAMLDPSCADITARIIEMLGTLGHKADHPAIARGLEYLWKNQEPEGCWYGRWGINYIYGTWQVLQGLASIDYPMNTPALVKAADWLESVQQSNGGWGETCATYDDPTLKGTGATTASQTAWAVLGLIAAGRAESEAVARGIQYLLDIQAEDGTWNDEVYTGTGFPKVFYMKYHLYQIYFPIMAIARYAKAVSGELAGS